MKKLNVFLTLFLCMCFAQMSAQYSLRYEVDPLCTLEIKITGPNHAPQTLYIPLSDYGMVRGGSIDNIAEGDLVEVSGYGSRDHLYPTWQDDDPQILGSLRSCVPGDYYWESGHDTFNGSIEIPCNWFVGMYQDYINTY